MMNGPDMLKKVKGNLIDLAEQGKFNVIVQGCNCFNTMGGGIAKEIRQRYPAAASIDIDTVRGDYNKLGNYTVAVNQGERKLGFDIINAYTQYDMSTGQDVFEYAAFQLILQKLAFAYPGKRFGFPLIGQGLAKGDPVRINEMLENFATAIAASGGTVTIVKFNQS